MKGAVKYPLYRCKLEDGDEPRSFRIVTPTRHVLLQCGTDEVFSFFPFSPLPPLDVTDCLVSPQDLVSWLNSILKQKIVVEDRIDSIMIESMKTRKEEESRDRE
jgi:hypothetical protein